MNLKMALATLGLSVVAASAAFAQVPPPVTLVADPTNYPLVAAPGIVDILGTFTYTGPVNGAPVFAAPSQQAAGAFILSNGTGYGDPTPAQGGVFPLLNAGFIPLVLSGNAATGFQSFNGPILSQTFTAAASFTTGQVFYDIFDSDPFGANPVLLGTVSARFTIGTAPVPEPGTVALLVGMGVAGLALRRRRK